MKSISMSKNRKGSEQGYKTQSIRQWGTDTRMFSVVSLLIYRQHFSYRL